MPPTIPDRKGQFFKQQGRAVNDMRGLASQQQNDFATPSGQVALRTGILYQYPPASDSPTNYTSGYGQEVLAGGSGSPPVLRMGVITWVSPSGGTRTITGLAFFDSPDTAHLTNDPTSASNGVLRVAWGLVDTSGTYTQGAQVFDTNGNAIGYLPYFNAGAYVGELTF